MVLGLAIEERMKRKDISNTITIRLLLYNY